MGGVAIVSRYSPILQAITCRNYNILNHNQTLRHTNSSYKTDAFAVRGGIFKKHLEGGASSINISDRSQKRYEQREGTDFSLCMNEHVRDLWNMQSREIPVSTIQLWYLILASFMRF